jgi:hypothetical protein
VPNLEQVLDDRGGIGTQRVERLEAVQHLGRGAAHHRVEQVEEL